MKADDMTVAELLALCGSANHDADGKTMRDMWDALGEAHPAVAGNLVEQTRRAIDESDGGERGTASQTEHPDWHESLERAKIHSQSEGY